ncbi:MAG: P44/Msp2 family outer membrane protein [Pseudomonadota bacterium]
MKLAKTLTTGVAFLALAGAAAAQEYYVGGSLGLNNQSDSDNSGVTGAFTTGNLGDGSTLDVAAGTDYGWTTEFDSGAAFGLEFGARYANGLRAAVEFAYTGADVDTHKDVTLGGGSIDGLDAASIAGATDPIGATVAQVVSVGRGDITNTAFFVNGYYDFNRESSFQPYVGVGLGFSDVSVNYQPSGIEVIDGSETKFAYQGKLGVTWWLNPSVEVFGEYAYRATEDIELNNELFPGTLDIENQSNSFSIGARYRFGG